MKVKNEYSRLLKKSPDRFYLPGDGSLYLCKSYLELFHSLTNSLIVSLTDMIRSALKALLPAKA